MLSFASFRKFCGFPLAALSFAVPAVSRAQSGYTIIDLGAPKGGASIGYSINNNGQVAGLYSAISVTASTQAVVWTNGVGMVISPAGSTSGSFALRIEIT